MVHIAIKSNKLIKESGFNYEHFVIIKQAFILSIQDNDKQF